MGFLERADFTRADESPSSMPNSSSLHAVWHHGGGVEHDEWSFRPRRLGVHHASRQLLAAA